jgi:hypothetical protein
MSQIINVIVFPSFARIPRRCSDRIRKAREGPALRLFRWRGISWPLAHALVENFTGMVHSTLANIAHDGGLLLGWHAGKFAGLTLPVLQRRKAYR